MHTRLDPGRDRSPMRETVIDEPRRASVLRTTVSRSILAWLGLLVSAAFTYLAVRHVHFHEVWVGLRTSEYEWLLPALAALALCMLLRAIRWQYMFAAETRPGLAATSSSLLIGYFFNSVLPARAGEAVRIVALNQRAGTSRAETASTVVAERLYDVLGLLVLFFVALPWLPHVSWLRAAVVLAIAVAGGVAAGVLVLKLFGARPLRFALRPLARLPIFSTQRVEILAENLVHGLAALRRPRLALAVFFWTMASWVAAAVSAWFVMRGFTLGVSSTAALLVVVATNLAMILPSSPSGIGVYEAAVLAAMSPYGVSKSAALPFALVFHAVNFFPYIAVGLYLLRGSLAIRRAGIAVLRFVPVVRRSSLRE
jgi:uncharacterized protein (TIRG00374 family)